MQERRKRGKVERSHVGKFMCVVHVRISVGEEEGVDFGRKRSTMQQNCIATHSNRKPKQLPFFLSRISLRPLWGTNFNFFFCIGLPFVSYLIVT